MIKNLHRPKKIYTAAARGARDKYEVWQVSPGTRQLVLKTELRIVFTSTQESCAPRHLGRGASFLGSKGLSSSPAGKKYARL